MPVGFVGVQRIRWARVLGYVAWIVDGDTATRSRAWAGDTCTAMDEPTSLKFVNRRIGELTKEYAAAQTTHARTSAIVEELSQLSIVRDELKKIQGKVYTAEQPTERPKIETLFREMDKLARQMTRRGERIETGVRSSMRSRDLAFSLTLYPNQKLTMIERLSSCEHLS